MIHEIVQDPINDGWRVVFDGRLTSPCFNSRAAAEAYLNMLVHGTREPEWL